VGSVVSCLTVLPLVGSNMVDVVADVVRSDVVGSNVVGSNVGNCT